MAKPRLSNRVEALERRRGRPVAVVGLDLNMSDAEREAEAARAEAEGKDVIVVRYEGHPPHPAREPAP